MMNILCNFLYRARNPNSQETVEKVELPAYFRKWEKSS